MREGSEEEPGFRLDEHGLIELTRQGDLNAFNRLVLSYQDRVFRQAVWMLGEAETAQDITQETFLLAYQKLSSFQDGSFRAWLLKIATRLCLDELRRRKRRKNLPLEPLNLEGEEIDWADWMIDPAESPEAAAERADLRQKIEREIAALDPEFRAVLILVDLQAMDYAEAAESLGIPIGTVKSRLARGRVRLRRLLGNRPEDSQAGGVAVAEVLTANRPDLPGAEKASQGSAAQAALDDGDIAIWVVVHARAPAVAAE